MDGPVGLDAIIRALAAGGQPVGQLAQLLPALGGIPAMNRAAAMGISPLTPMGQQLVNGGKYGSTTEPGRFGRFGPAHR